MADTGLPSRSPAKTQGTNAMTTAMVARLWVLMENLVSNTLHKAAPSLNLLSSAAFQTTTLKKASDESLTGKEHQVFASQKKQAEKLYYKIFDSLPQMISVLNVLIVVPSRESLRAQTQQRVELFENYAKDKFPQARPEIKVVMANHGKTYKKIIQEFFSAQKKLPPGQFFLILHDECHWGANLKGLVSQILSQVSEDPNLLMIQISATAWNQLELLRKVNNPAADLLEKNVLRWNEHNDGQKSYFGLHQMVHHNRILSDSEIERIAGKLTTYLTFDPNFPGDEALKNRLSKKSSSPEALCMCIGLLYLRALLYFHFKNDTISMATLDRIPWFRDSKCQTTMQAVEEMFKGGLIAVRLPSGTLASQFSSLITQLLMVLKLDTKAFVIHDANETSAVSPFKGTADAVTVTQPCFDELLRRQKSGNNSVKEPSLNSYERLNGLGCLLVVVEKARMGDTLPQNFKYFDLRARYTRPFTLSAFLQDIGRAFAWSERVDERPLVLLNPFCFNIIKNLEEAVRQRKVRIDRYLKAPNIPKDEIGDSDEDDEDEEEEDPNEMNSNPDAQVRKSAESLALFFHPTFEVDLSQNHYAQTLQSLASFQNTIKRRFILSAEPQIGKTGCYLHLLELISTHARKPPMEDQLLSNREFILLLRRMRALPSADLHSLLVGDEQWRVDWDRLNEIQDFYFHLNNEIFPAARAVKFASRLDLTNSSTIVDAGCGTCQFANLYKGPATVINIDHRKYPLVSVDVLVLNFQDIQTEVGEKSVDLVVFSVFLSWGSEEDRNKKLEVATRILKPGGRLLILEHQPDWPSESLLTRYQLLQPLGRRNQDQIYWAQTFIRMEAAPETF